MTKKNLAIALVGFALLAFPKPSTADDDKPPPPDDDHAFPADTTGGTGKQTAPLSPPAPVRVPASSVVYDDSEFKNRERRRETSAKLGIIYDLLEEARKRAPGPARDETHLDVMKRLQELYQLAEDNKPVAYFTPEEQGRIETARNRLPPQFRERAQSIQVRKRK